MLPVCWQVINPPHLKGLSELSLGFPSQFALFPFASSCPFDGFRYKLSSSVLCPFSEKA